jgi:NTE family protein
LSPRRDRRDFPRRAALRATGLAPGPDGAATVIHLPAAPAFRPEPSRPDQGHEQHEPDGPTHLDQPGQLPQHEQPGTGRPPGRRWGLVLGGGGVLGAAWMVGALQALERTHGLDARDADLIVGTSAGSVVGALLAAGVSVDDQVAQQAGGRMEVGTLKQAPIDADRIGGSSRPPRPRLRPGSPAILRNNRGSLRQLPVSAVVAGLVPAGRGQLREVSRLIEAVVPAGRWSPGPGFRAVALDYESGRRVVFGAPGAPPAGLSEAVLASCSIPGWFEPVPIGGRRYVDGGMWSVANVDVVAGAGLEEVFVLAPMVSAAYDEPADWKVRIERRIRITNTRRTLAEAREVAAAGTAVTLIGPGPAELRLMGYNFMAPRRRWAVLESATGTALREFATPTPPAGGTGQETSTAKGQTLDVDRAAQQTADRVERG